MPEPDRDELSRWLREEIYPEVADLYHRRQFVRDVVEFLGGRVGDHFFFLDVVTRMYVDSQASAVRRLVTGRSDSISLVKLMKTIQGAAEQFTKTYFEGQWDLPDSSSTQVHDQARLQVFAPKMEEQWLQFAPGGGTTLEKDIVEKDIVGLEEAASSVKKYVNRIVAHIDLRGLEDFPTFDDLDKAVDAIGITYCKYETLLTGSAHQEFVAPVVQGDILSPLRPLGPA